jgi:nicotinamide riboside transporter PnuC
MRASTYAIIIGITASLLEIYLFSSNEFHSKLALVLFLGSIVTIPLTLYFKKRSFITLIAAYAQLTVVCTVF